VRPWFWETWWFRAAGVASVLLAVTAGTTLVQRSRHRHELETMRHQRALEDERARISRDMHDEVGASLTEIAILSELAVRRDSPNGTRRGELEKIAGRSRAMLDAIGEIIWALNPEHDPPDHLASYLREYAATFLENTGHRGELSFETSPAAGPLTSDFRRNVFLILKEALANVAKHAQARSVRIDLDLDDERLTLMIADDGVGFARDSVAGARHGLGNLERRANALGGSVSIEPAPAGGTCVRLDVPLPFSVRAGKG
jgi:signal transduction histidine kinase